MSGICLAYQIQELEEALQQAEDRNQLINEEFKQLLKDKEVGCFYEVRPSSCS